ncbi:MAG: hypothetical protein U0165_02175 [Polyangiaceae bacterium]
MFLAERRRAQALAMAAIATPISEREDSPVFLPTERPPPPVACPKFSLPVEAAPDAELPADEPLLPLFPLDPPEEVPPAEVPPVEPPAVPDAPPAAAVPPAPAVPAAPPVAPSCSPVSLLHSVPSGHVSRNLHRLTRVRDALVATGALVELAVGALLRADALQTFEVRRARRFVVDQAIAVVVEAIACLLVAGPSAPARRPSTAVSSATPGHFRRARSFNTPCLQRYSGGGFSGNGPGKPSGSRSRLCARSWVQADRP